jgi:YegS/Rv2252/BmrU family lipid kinase
MPERKHLVFIINPRSGRDRVKAIQASLEATIDRTRFSFEIQYTVAPQHGTELARAAAEKGAWAVVAVGGDGSVADIAAALAGSNTALGIIPKGSGNGLARTLKIPLELDQALQVINQGKIQQIDLGYVNDKMFISNAGVGFDALISKKFAKSERRGLSVYSWLVTKYLWLYREWNWTIYIDGRKIETPAFLVNVANGQQFGYNFKIAPNASVTDGRLDVTIIRSFPKIFGGVLALRARYGDIADSSYVECIQAKTLTIEHPDLKWMQTDGDPQRCANRLDFRVEPGALKVIVP